MAALAAATGAQAQELTQLSLEDLLAQQVTSVAKRPQDVRSAPAAVFIIGREDIRRSGARTIPDILRMAPGLEVAQVAGGRAAVSARGFNSEISNKLLVLVDGRAVYNSALSSVVWDQQLTPVEDIERIEVVRGPGATLWGANAVNGVINIITKHAVDTLDGLATAQADTGDSGRVYLRDGFRVGENGALRVYGVAHSDEANAVLGAVKVDDRWRGGQAGFRFDGAPNDRDAYTLQGDIQGGRFRPTAPPGSLGPRLVPLSGDFGGENLLGRWTRTSKDAGRMTLQAYYDRTERLQYGVRSDRRVFDVDFSRQVRLDGRHDIVWGLGYRRTELKSPPGHPLRLFSSNQDWYGGFIQDDVSLKPDRLTLSLGAKLERNPKTGVELQPSVRAIWTDPAGWSAWGAVSRAVRTPSELETNEAADFRPAFQLLVGQVASETLVAYEVGWRGRLGRSLSVDATAYYNSYRDLIGTRGALTFAAGVPALEFHPANIAQARAWGAEASVDARVRPWWTLKAAASLLQIKTESSPGMTFSIGALGDEDSPKSQVSLRSMMDLGDSVDLDLWLRHVARLEGGGAKAYADLDLRAAWRPRPGLELAVQGANLLNHRGPELPGFAIIQDATELSDRRLILAVSVKY